MTEPSPSPPRVFLLPGRDKRLAAGHPWVYSNEMRMDAGAKAVAPGSAVTLHRVDGKPLGLGTFNPHCLIAFRLFSRDHQAAIDGDLLRDRLVSAMELRRPLYDEPFHRLVHGEADGLPGLVIDRFGDALAVQTATAGMEALLPLLLEVIDEVLSPTAVILRNDGAFRKLEGLDSYVRTARGEMKGAIEVREGGLRFVADLMEGQKTGWYFDQAPNRAFVAPLGRGGGVLDVFSHSGAFAISAAAAGASRVIAIDSSERALELAAEAARANGVDGKCDFRRQDAFAELERLGNSRERFRLVIADPPAFVKSRKDLNAGLKGYRKLARLAARLVEPGGFLFLASCSHNVETGRFADEVARGIARAGRQGRILRSAGAGPDHPTHPHLPESAYLKTMTLRLD